jgi:hypothetical protein
MPRWVIFGAWCFLLATTAPIRAERLIPPLGREVVAPVQPGPFVLEAFSVNGSQTTEPVLVTPGATVELTGRVASGKYPIRYIAPCSIEPGVAVGGEFRFDDPPRVTLWLLVYPDTSPQQAAALGWHLVGNRMTRGRKHQKEIRVRFEAPAEPGRYLLDLWLEPFQAEVDPATRKPRPRYLPPGLPIWRRVLIVDPHV